MESIRLSPEDSARFERTGENDRLQRSGGRYRMLPGGIAELWLPDGYALRSVAGRRDRAMSNGRARTRSTPAPSRAKSDTDAVIELLVDMINSLLDEHSGPMSAKHEILRRLCIETGDSSTWEHCADLVSKLVDRAYMAHRKNCKNICQVADPEIGAADFRQLLRDADFSFAYRADRLFN